MPKRNYAYYARAFEGLSKPFAFLDLDRMNRNTEEILKKSGDKNIRLATKSLRSVEVIRHLLNRSERIRGLMCFSAPEALYLSDQGLDDLLIGYPVWDPEQIRPILRSIGEGRRITLMVDSIAHVEHIESIARKEGVRCPLCVDIDLSVRFPGLHFGVRRSPIRSKEELFQVVLRITASNHLVLDGLMGYEAQVAGVGDHVPRRRLQNTLVRLLKKHSVETVAKIRAEWVQAIRETGVPLRFVNGGGTGSIHTTSREAAVTEITVGSGFYSPGLFDAYRDFRYEPAAGFALEIVRIPDPGIYTCAGGGYIASGSAGRDKLPRPFLPEGARLLPLEGAGEVQTPVRYTGPVPLKLGDPIFFRHAKAGELCEHFPVLYCLSEGDIVREAKTYRGDGRCFL